MADCTPPPAELPDRATGGGGGNSFQQCEDLPPLSLPPSGRNEVAAVVADGTGWNKLRCILENQSILTYWVYHKDPDALF